MSTFAKSIYEGSVRSLFQLGGAPRSWCLVYAWTASYTDFFEVGFFGRCEVQHRSSGVYYVAL